jgi:hypothetical protein
MLEVGVSDHCSGTSDRHVASRVSEPNADLWRGLPAANSDLGRFLLQRIVHALIAAHSVRTASRVRADIIFEKGSLNGAVNPNRQMPLRRSASYMPQAPFASSPGFASRGV